MGESDSVRFPPALESLQLGSDVSNSVWFARRRVTEPLPRESVPDAPVSTQPPATHCPRCFSVKPSLSNIFCIALFSNNSVVAMQFQLFGARTAERGGALHYPRRYRLHPPVQFAIAQIPISPSPASWRRHP